MKLKALTNIKPVKSDKPKVVKNKQKKKDTKKVYIKNQLLPLSLALEISKNYEGISDSIGGVLNDLPIELKTLFTNAQITKTTLRQGFAMFVLSNGFTIIIKDITISGKVCTDITIKQKKKQVFHTVIK